MSRELNNLCQEKRNSKFSWQCMNQKSKNNPISKIKLHRINQQILSHKINFELSKPIFLETINRIVEHEPSKQLVQYQQVIKASNNQEYLRKYYNFEKIMSRINKLIQKRCKNLKSRYLDFKRENYAILTKYPMARQRVINESYKRSTPTDSKMSSTKQVQNKVLLELELQMREKIKWKKGSKTKKTNKNQNSRIQIKELTEKITDMIQGIKDNRILQQFKREMKKKSTGLFVAKQDKGIKQKHYEENMRERKQIEFKKSVEKKMNQIFNSHRAGRTKQKSAFLSKQQIQSGKTSKSKSKEISKNLQFSKSKQKQKNTLGFKYKQHKQRLETQVNNIGQLEDYGLSMYRDKYLKNKNSPKKNRKESRSRELMGNENKSSKKMKSKTKDSQSNKLYDFDGGMRRSMSKSKRMKTQYSAMSKQKKRMKTQCSAMSKQKSSSRIPTQYDTATIISKPRKSKSKSKDNMFFKFNPKSQYTTLNNKGQTYKEVKKIKKQQNTSQFHDRSKSKSLKNHLKFTFHS